MSALVHIVIDSNDFNEQLKEAGNKLVVVDFFATWCGPCKIIGPKVDTMAEQFTDVVFLKVDVDDCEDIASKYEISCMPTFLFFKSGEKVETFSGANAEKIKEFVMKHKWGQVPK